MLSIGFCQPQSNRQRFAEKLPLLVGFEFGDVFDVVYPKATILAENPVSVVDKVVDRKGTRKQAEGFYAVHSARPFFG